MLTDLTCKFCGAILACKLEGILFSVGMNIFYFIYLFRNEYFNSSVLQRYFGVG